MNSTNRLIGINSTGDHYYFSGASSNPQMGVTGISGKGKTFTCLKQVIQAAKSGEKVLVLNLRKAVCKSTIHPELYEEYDRFVCRHDVASEGLTLPLFTRFPDENGNQEKEETAVNRITAMFTSACDLKPTQKAIAHNAIRDVCDKGYYQEDGISAIYDWLISQKSATAKNTAGKILPLCASNIIREGELLDDKKPITEIDLNGLDYDEQLMFARFILHYIQRAAMRGSYIKTPLVVFVDEIQSIFMDQKASEPLEILLNEGRRLNVKLILACPSILSSAKKKTNALMQCSTMLFFEPLASEREKIAKIIDPKDPESMNYALSILKVGECMAKGTFQVKSKDGTEKTVTGVFKLKTKVEGDTYNETTRRKTDSKVHSDKAAS